MPNNFGISFIPSADNQSQGPAQGKLQGDLAPTTDLASAYKILSLRLPTVVGASSPVKSSLLTSLGAGGLQLPNGMNAYTALFEALIKASAGASSEAPPLGSPGAPKIVLGTKPSPPPVWP